MKKQQVGLPRKRPGIRCTEVWSRLRSGRATFHAISVCLDPGRLRYPLVAAVDPDTALKSLKLQSPRPGAHCAKPRPATGQQPGQEGGGEITHWFYCCFISQDCASPGDILSVKNNKEYEKPLFPEPWTLQNNRQLLWDRSKLTHETSAVDWTIAHADRVACPPLPARAEPLTAGATPCIL